MSPSLRVVLIVCLLSLSARGAELYVAANGNDSDPGSLAKPFASLQRAQEAASPGDTVLVRGGTYVMREDQIARKERIWAYVFLLDKSGTPDKRISYFAYKDERPIFDFSQVKPAGLRIDAFYVPASWIHLKGLEVIGVQVTIQTHTQSICFANDGSHNIYEQLRMHDGMAIGIYSLRGSDNLFLNCDAYRNYDSVSEGGRGGNVDGFGGHPPAGSTGNVFRGCRAWFNSDDGFDCINAHEAVTFENCWAFYNGYSPTFERLADGNGFKAGGYGATAADRLPKSIPRHIVRFCLAVRNKANGIYANHHPGGVDFISNTSYLNSIDFNMQGRLIDNRTEIAGTGHKLRNNLAYKGGVAITNIDTAKCDALNNSFNLNLNIGDSDFLSTDESELIQPRTPTGDLPPIKFMHLAPASRLIDRGVDTGSTFNGARPDLGAFEN